MLWTIAVVLVILWLLGLVNSYTMGGFVHITRPAGGCHHRRVGQGHTGAKNPVACGKS